MATYKFPQFNVEIVNPTIEIDMNTIGDRAIDKELSVNVLLIVLDAKFGVKLENMSYVDTWDDADVLGMVETALTAFEV